MDTKNLGFDSKLIHAGDFKDEYGSAVTPIYQTSTFSFKNSQHGANLFAGTENGYIYTRIGNPTINALEISCESFNDAATAPPDETPANIPSFAASARVVFSASSWETSIIRSTCDAS